MFEGIELDKIDISANPPAEEPVRQYYFMAKCRQLLQAMEAELGRKPTFFVDAYPKPA